LAEQEFELNESPANFDLSKSLDFSKTTKKQNYADNNEGIIHVKPSEVRQLRESVETVRDELLIKLMYQTGLRRSEVAALKLPEHKSDSHIDTEKNQVVVSEDDSKTNNGGRTVPYQDLEPELTMWLSQGFRDRHCYADDSPYLFLTKQTPSISGTTISRIIRDAAEDAGIQEVYGKDADGNPKRRITAHSLRSAFVIQLFDAGLPSPKVMELSGHEQLETVESYANVLDDDAISAYRNADIDFEA
jgi:integrase/recombinase XerD